MSTLGQLTPELLRRWIQFSAFCPVMRTKAGGIEVPEYRRPQIWDPDVLPTWRRHARWHTRLNDYLMAAHETYRATGRPIMCARRPFPITGSCSRFPARLGQPGRGRWARASPAAGTPAGMAGRWSCTRTDRSPGSSRCHSRRRRRAPPAPPGGRSPTGC
jgi:hypothetical protein